MKIDDHRKNDNDRGEACRADEKSGIRSSRVKAAQMSALACILGVRASPPRRSMENILASSTGSSRIAGQPA